MNRKVVYIKNLKRNKYKDERINDISPRYVLTEELPNGDCLCAINANPEVSILIECEDIETIQTTIFIKAQDGIIYECGGFSNYEGKISCHTLESTNVTLATYRSWGYTSDVASKIRKLHKQGAFYVEVPLVENHSLFSSVSFVELNPQFDPDIAIAMGNWEVISKPEWLWRVWFLESVNSLDKEWYRITATHATCGYGNFLRYEGKREDFNQEAFVEKAKEFRDRIDSKNFDSDLGIYDSLFSDPSNMFIKGKFKEHIFATSEGTEIVNVVQ
jgi:hypothetical protein